MAEVVASSHPLMRDLQDKVLEEMLRKAGMAGDDPSPGPVLSAAFTTGEKRAKETKRILHECGGASSMFYCTAQTNEEVGDMIDWYAHEDLRDAQGPDAPVASVPCIEYCPWCGVKLAETYDEAMAAGDIYSVEDIEKEVQYDEETGELVVTAELADRLTEAAERLGVDTDTLILTALEEYVKASHEEEKARQDGS